MKLDIRQVPQTAMVHGASTHNGREVAEVRRWEESSTVGVLGCFLVSIGLLLLAVWIAWIIMESSIPG
jgi:hypothetical protein